MDPGGGRGQWRCVKESWRRKAEGGRRKAEGSLDCAIGHSSPRLSRPASTWYGTRLGPSISSAFRLPPSAFLLPPSSFRPPRAPARPALRPRRDLYGAASFSRSTAPPRTRHAPHRTSSHHRSPASRPGGRPESRRPRRPGPGRRPHRRPGPGRFDVAHAHLPRPDGPDDVVHGHPSAEEGREAPEGDGRFDQAW